MIYKCDKPDIFKYCASITCDLWWLARHSLQIKGHEFISLNGAAMSTDLFYHHQV